jgi:hypothetical protein
LRWTNVAAQTYSERKGIEMKNSCKSEAGRKPLSSQEREIFSRLGMVLNNEPCRRTPPANGWRRRLRARIDGPGASVS